MLQSPSDPKFHAFTYMVFTQRRQLLMTTFTKSKAMLPLNALEGLVVTLSQCTDSTSGPTMRFVHQLQRRYLTATRFRHCIMTSNTVFELQQRICVASTNLGLCFGPC